MHPSSGLDPERLRPSGALLAAHIALGAALDRCALEQVHVDPTVVDLLVRLELAPGQQLRAVEICRQLLLSPSHISRVVDRAESVGLIQRRPDPDDRRASLITITRSGRDTVQSFVPCLDAVLDTSIYSVLDADEVDTLVALLERIEAAARTYNNTDNKKE